MPDTKPNLSSTQKPKLFYGWYMVAASWFMVFLSGAFGFGVFFKPMLEEFGWDRATLSSAQSIAFVVYAVNSPFLGRVLDRFGPRIMIFSTVVTQALTGAIGGLATSLWQVFLSRFFFELRAFAYTQVLVNRWFDRKKGTALGIVATGMPVGTLVLAPVSQYLILAWDWRITMFFWGGVMFVIILALSFYVRDYPQDKGYAPDGEPLDTVKPVQSISRPGSSASGVKQMISAGSGLSAAMKAAAFWLLAVTQLICGIGCGFLMTHIVIFTTDAGFPDMIAASMLSAQAGVNLVALILTGHLSDRMARNKVLALTHFMRCLSFVVLVSFVLIGGNSLWMLYLAMALFGFGWFTTAPLSSGLVADIFGGFRMGTILGFMWAAHMLGMAIGAYAGGAIYELTGSYYLVFIIQGVLEFLAAGFALLIRRKPAHQAVLKLA